VRAFRDYPSPGAGAPNLGRAHPPAIPISLETLAMDDKKLSDAVNRSGFPLQIALQRLVERTHPGDWNVCFSEHYWFNPADNCSGFIDLSLENGRADTVFVVECKRVVNCSWIFLIDDKAQMERRHAKAWVTNSIIGEPLRFGFEEVEPEPMTPQSQYCVVDGQDPNARPMLERIASILVSSTEGFATEEQRGMARVDGETSDVLRIYFSVIVTTAKLRVCAFDPQSISLSTAEITNPAYKEVPFLRFRKQLGSHREIPKISARHRARHRAIAAAKESTVFIVNSESFSDFLQRFDIAALGPAFP